MSYQIRYDSQGKVKRMTVRKYNFRYIPVACITVAMLVLMLCLSGGDWKVTVDAMDAMAENLTNGDSLREAFAGFCFDVLQGAELG